MRNFFLVFLASASAIFAQGAQVGVGVGLENNIFSISQSSNSLPSPLLRILPVNFTTISLPILINGTGKVEPELGYVRSSRSQSGSSAQSFDNSTSILQLGLTISGGKRVDNLLYLYGVKGGMTRTASSEDGGTTTFETSQTNFFIGPVLGAEYFFLPHFSFAAQAGFSFIFVGQTDETPSPSGSTPDVSETVMGVGTKITLQWYY